MKLSRRQLMQGASGLLLPAWAHAGLVTQSGARYFASGSEPETFDFYISTTGTGTASGGGSISDPWPITMLNNTTARARYAGKRIGLMDGTYGLIDIFGQHSGSFDTGILKVYNTGGSESARTVLKAINRHAAIIDFQRDSMTNTDESAALQPAGSYVTVDGIKFINSNYRCITNYSGGGSYFTVQNCWFYDQVFNNVSGSGKNSAMVFSQSHDNILVRNCRFELGGAPGDSNRHSFVQFYDTTNGIIEYNTIIGNDGSITGGPSGNCIHFKEVDNHLCTARWNFIDQTECTNSFSDNCVRWHCNGTTDGSEKLYGNVLVAGSFAAPLESEGTSNTWEIYNNTIIGNPKYEAAGLDHLELGSPTQTNIYNNIFSRTTLGSRGDMQIRSVATLGTMDYNLYDGSPALTINVNTGGGSSSGLAAWQSASSKDANSAETTDPLFVASGSEAAYYQLQSGSAAKTLGAGSTEIGAWNSGHDAYGPGYNASRS